MFDLNHKKSKLVMLVPKPDSESFWLIDPFKPSFSDLNQENLALLCTKNLVICPDAKETLKRLQIAPSPHLRFICLHTIKKLLTRIDVSLDLPNFNDSNDSNEAFTWALDAIESAFRKINDLGLETLVSLECAVIPATLAMEQAGLPFDKNRWQESLEQFVQESQSLKLRLEKYLVKSSGFALFGPEPLDLNNASAVKKGLETLLKTKLSSTSQSSLKNYDHEAVKLLLRYREQTRMVSTYGENFLNKIKNNRIYASFEPLGSASGRFACHNPNLQALPSDAVFQDCIRSVAPYKLINFDYGAFELRILAALSGDANLVNIFNDGLDIHSMVAEAIFKCPVSKTENKNLREQAKVLNFGIVYGMGERALAAQLKISQEKAASMMKEYFERYPRVKEFLVGLENNAQQKGYVNTILGRRLNFAGERDENSLRRIARNMPIQGTGADIAKYALCRVFSRITNEGLDARIVNMIHDELVIESHQDEILRVSEIVQIEMKKAFCALLPELEAEIGVAVS